MPVDLSTRRLRYFVVLAEELHFTRAAKRLFMSQQALSGQIRELERTLGFGLFERSTRLVRLTDAGSVFLEGARAALAALDHSADEARQLQRQVLRVGFMVTSALELTPHIVHEFRRRHPDVEVRQYEYQWRDPTCGLLTDEVHVAIVRPPIDCPDLRMEELFVEPRCAAVADTHRLAALDRVTVEDLSAERILAPHTTDESWTRFWTLRDVAAPALPSVLRSVGSIDEELGAVTSGAAISITPMGMARYAPRPDVVFRPIDGVAGTSVALAWREPGCDLALALRDAAIDVRRREAELVAWIESADGSHSPPPVARSATT